MCSRLVYIPPEILQCPSAEIDVPYTMITVHAGATVVLRGTAICSFTCNTPDSAGLASGSGAPHEMLMRGWPEHIMKVTNLHFEIDEHIDVLKNVFGITEGELIECANQLPILAVLQLIESAKCDIDAVVRSLDRHGCNGNGMTDDTAVVKHQGVDYPRPPVDMFNSVSMKSYNCGTVFDLTETITQALNVMKGGISSLLKSQVLWNKLLNIDVDMYINPKDPWLSRAQFKNSVTEYEESKLKSRGMKLRLDSFSTLAEQAFADRSVAVVLDEEVSDEEEESNEVMVDKKAQPWWKVSQV